MIVYLANLTHSYISLANATFPLGVGYIASALKKVFKNDIQVEIFKYVDDLDRAIQNSKPDVFLFGGYMWTHNLPLAFAERIKVSFPDTLVVAGGPDISRDAQEKKKYLQQHPYLDFYVLYEGEEAICSLLSNYLKIGKNISKLKEMELSSVITLMPDGQMKAGKLLPRIGVQSKAFNDLQNTNHFFNSLDDIPSPYLTGLMDKFFDNKLQPLIETNRGCPFSCSYCQQGQKYFNHVVLRSLDVIKEELEYISYQMSQKSPHIPMLQISDSNFGMFPRDSEICSAIRSLQEKYLWPRIVGCSTGKGNIGTVLNSISKLLPDSLVVSLSVQSTNPDTLKAIHRMNFDMAHCVQLNNALIERRMRSQADVILGLPLETSDSHFSAIYNLIDMGIQEFTPYQAMILKSSDLEEVSVRAQYGFVTKWRLVPRAIGSYDICATKKIVLEAEEINVATATLSFKDYLDCRKLHLVIMIFNNAKIFDLVLTYLKSRKVGFSRLIREIFALSNSDGFLLKPVFDGLLTETQAELFDTQKDCIDFYSDPVNLERVKQGTIGNNLLFKYLSVTLFEYWQQAIDVLLVALSKITDLDPDAKEDLSQILNNQLINISMPITKKDITLTLKSSAVLELLKNADPVCCKTPSKNCRITLRIRDQQYEDLVKAKNIYPNNHIGRSLILANYRVQNLLRDIVID